MLKCKYNEDCSRYPMCGKTCGLSLEELVWLKNSQIRELERKLGEATFTLNTITSMCHSGKNKIKKADYEPTCPYGYMDCVSDPAYIRAYHPKWWEELGMPTECESADEYEEGCSCRYYDDEDK